MKSAGEIDQLILVKIFYEEYTFANYNLRLDHIKRCTPMATISKTQNHKRSETKSLELFIPKPEQ